MEFLGVDTRMLFTAVVGLEATERMAELVLSRRNAARTIAAGGVESGLGVNRTVVVLHVLWLAACVGEVWLLDRPFVPALAACCAVLLVAAMAMRLWAMATLRERWNIRIITVPGEPPLRAGPYRILRHPNYLALYVELAALPLLHSAWWTATVLGVPHAVAVWLKSRSEDRALGYRAGSGGCP